MTPDTEAVRAVREALEAEGLTAGPWFVVRSIPEEGYDGWWVKSQPNAAMRGFTSDLGWINGSDENEPNAKFVEAARNHLPALLAERDALVGALPPSAETKSAYMGEFSVPLPDIVEGENGEAVEVMRRINVPWTTIKEIMAAIRARAALQEPDNAD